MPTVRSAPGVTCCTRSVPYAARPEWQPATLSGAVWRTGVQASLADLLNCGFEFLEILRENRDYSLTVACLIEPVCVVDNRFGCPQQSLQRAHLLLRSIK